MARLVAVGGLAMYCLGAVTLLATAAGAAPTRSSPIGVSAGAAGDVVFAVNPDSDSVARIPFDTQHRGGPALEAKVGRYPRTLALAGEAVFTADQRSGTVSRLAQADLSGRAAVDLGLGCSPYGIAATPDQSRVLVSCQGTSELVLLDPGSLAIVARVRLPWPNARALAVASDGARAYVTHYLSEEPRAEAHVSVVDLANASVAAVFTVAADLATCETQNSGQGVLNLVSAIALTPDTAPAEVRNQVWVGGTQENNVSKGLFKRYPGFREEPGAALFPLLTFTPFPEPAPIGRRRRRRPSFPSAAASRNKYKASFHDITRFAIYKLDAGDGRVLGKIDVDEANNATDIEFSADGTTAYVVDLMFDSYHLFSTRKGQAGDVTTVFAPPSAFGPGGADPTAPCVPDALQPVANEVPFRIAPQAQLSVIDGFNPVDTTFTVVSTGVDFDTATFMTSGLSRMRPVPDGIGTAPIGVRLSPDGTAAYVANYLARNVVPVATAAPRDTTGRPVNLRCTANVTQTCATDTDCPSDQGFCNHPGGPACTSSTDCGADGPCINRSDCVPLILGAPVSSLADPDPVPAAILDGKILFNTAARDASVPNGIGLGAAAPLFNDPSLTARLPASVVSVSRDASYVTCSSCHADFGGQDGRTWDFSQFGASLRNTMDLRGRAAFAPGHCSQDAAVECFFDAACGEGNFCRMREELIPPNVPAEDRTRYFNPMLTAHWNGDRDEVEDFEHTFRQLLGAGDCDGTEDTVEGCPGALVQRSPLTSTDPVDVNDDLGVPNRNLRGRIDPSTIVGIRLTHVADFVYSLTEFVPNPNPITGAAARGRDLFNDPQMRCAQCHDSLGTVGRQLFTDKRPKRAGEDFVATEPAGADRNNPFLRHDVGTANLFDAADPFQVATATGSFQNPRSVPPIPASRGVLDEYLTPVLNDLWNTRPYLHDGSAHFLLDVVRPCDTHLDDCRRAGRGRNLDDRHGATSMLTPQDLNALTGFLRTLTVNTPVGVGERAVNSGTLILRRATLAFPRRGRPAFKASGILRAAPSRVDPAGGVTLSLATPGGEEMMIFSRRLATVRRGRGFMARSDEGGVAVRLRLRQLAGDRIRFTASGAGPGVAVLDTGNRDLAVALEVSGVSFVRNRNLAGRKRVFRIPRRRG